jgi:hypothetical protein
MDCAYLSAKIRVLTIVLPCTSAMIRMALSAVSAPVM